MSALTDFFLNSKSRVAQLECLEISHPNFSKTYYVVRNATLGVTVKHEDGVYHAYEYYPLQIVQNGDADDLDQGFSISLGDLGEIIPDEVDSVRSANGFGTKPTCKYRAYRSDDLDHVLMGPTFLEIKTFSFTREGCTFAATAPKLNVNTTGELYDLTRFDPLRGTI